MDINLMEIPTATTEEGNIRNFWVSGLYPSSSV
jgi:hypothetical protein